MFQINFIFYDIEMGNGKRTFDDVFCALVPTEATAISLGRQIRFPLQYTLRVSDVIF